MTTRACVECDAPTELRSKYFHRRATAAGRLRRLELRLQWLSWRLFSRAQPRCAGCIEVQARAILRIVAPR